MEAARSGESSSEPPVSAASAPSVDVSLSILMPAFNEAEGIRRAVTASSSVATMLPDHFRLDQIIVVDDGSTDETPTILSDLASNNPRLTVLRHDGRQGLGGALRTGLAAVSTDMVLYTDADLPIDLNQVGPALNLAADDVGGIVSCYRLNPEVAGLRRRVYSQAYGALIQRLFRLAVRDVNFAAKVIRSDVLAGLQLSSTGSFVDVELLVRARNAGHPIRQVGLQYQPRQLGESKLSSPRVILQLLTELARIAPGLRRDASRGA